MKKVRTGRYRLEFFLVGGLSAGIVWLIQNFIFQPIILKNGYGQIGELISFVILLIIFVLLFLLFNKIGKKLVPNWDTTNHEPVATTVPSD
ncbi:hypothetical protein QFZ31_001157 [Neobacillus niacini]|uniref:hypothetical protein n=1 Tax=Neobacillus driksii TaxID=3035913 RepID=UPI0027830875|nr:hypothetical protein [Neobacillus niacini]MDQ0971279.1 hypothetical protein [Neobacillus niacini]